MYSEIEKRTGQDQLQSIPPRPQGRVRRSQWAYECLPQGTEKPWGWLQSVPCMLLKPDTTCISCKFQVVGGPPASVGVCVCVRTHTCMGTVWKYLELRFRLKTHFTGQAQSQVRGRNVSHMCASPPTHTYTQHTCRYVHAFVVVFTVYFKLQKTCGAIANSRISGVHTRPPAFHLLDSAASLLRNLTQSH